MAVGRDAKGEANFTARTVGSVAKLSLSPDAVTATTAWDDVVFVRASVTDGDGILVPTANDSVKFSISGPGKILAVDNGDCLSTEPFQASERKAYGGCCVAIIRATAATGAITVTAETAGLAPSSVIIKAARNN